MQLKNRNYFRAYFTICNDEPAQSHRKLKSTRTGAPGIEEDHPVPNFLLRHVAVPVNHDFDSCRLRLHIEPRQIMKNIDRNSAEFHHVSLRQLARPCLSVDVASYGRDRRNRAKFIENLSPSNIAAMNDVFGPAQCPQRLRTKQPVGVGDDADDYRSPQFLVPGFRFSLIN